MNVIPIGRCLRDFSNTVTPGNTRPIDGCNDPEELAEACRLARQDGYAAGQRDAQAKMADEYDCRLAAEVAQIREHALASAAERDAQSAQWASETADTLQVALAQLEHQIADQVSGVLQSLVESAAERSAVVDIVRNYSRLGHDGKAKLSLSGPPELVEMLVRALPGVSIDVSSTPAIELSLRIDETELSTRLTDWRRSHLESRP